MPEATLRRLLRARMAPLVVTAVVPGGLAAVRLDPELLWAAGLVEFEEVEIRTGAGGRWQVPVMAGSAGEVEVLGDHCDPLLPGDVIAISAHAFQTDTSGDLPVHLVAIGEGNRAIEIRRHRPRAFPVHPSFAVGEPEDGKMETM